jgi:hypothetical protein
MYKGVSHALLGLPRCEGVELPLTITHLVSAFSHQRHSSSLEGNQHHP